MEKLSDNKIDLKTMSPLTLAFVGDGAYELFVREFLVEKGNCPVKKLHGLAVKMVRCDFQAKIVKETLETHLTDEEREVLKRGRNAKVGHVPKNASPCDYHAATAFECLFGYLYLKGEVDRLRYFFELISKNFEAEEIL